MAWTAPRTWSTSEVVTAANMNTYISDNLNAVCRELATGSLTSGSVTISGATEATATTIVTADAFTADGTETVLIECFIPRLSAGSGNTSLWLYLDGSSIGQLALVSSAVTETSVSVSRRLVPASGSRTYSLRGSVSGSNAVAYGNAGGTATIVPATIRITKVAP